MKDLDLESRVYSAANKEQKSQRWPVRMRQKAEANGACGYWRIRPLN